MTTIIMVYVAGFLTPFLALAIWCWLFDNYPNRSAVRRQLREAQRNS